MPNSDFNNDNSNAPDEDEKLSAARDDIDFLMRSLDKTNEKVMALSDELEAVRQKKPDMDKIADYVIEKMELNKYAKKRNIE